MRRLLVWLTVLAVVLPAGAALAHGHKSGGGSGDRNFCRASGRENVVNCTFTDEDDGEENVTNDNDFTDVDALVKLVVNRILTFEETSILIDVVDGDLEILSQCKATGDGSVQNADTCAGLIAAHVEDVADTFANVTVSGINVNVTVDH